MFFVKKKTQKESNWKIIVWTAQFMPTFIMTNISHWHFILMNDIYIIPQLLSGFKLLHFLFILLLMTKIRPYFSLYKNDWVVALFINMSIQNMIARQRKANRHKIFGRRLDHRHNKSCQLKMAAQRRWWKNKITVDNDSFSSRFISAFLLIFIADHV